MKQIILTKPHCVAVRNIDEPNELKEHDVLIEVKMVTLCGSDLTYFNRSVLPYHLSYPIVLGHEVSGIVKKIGEKVTKVKDGDRVTVEPQYYCGKCDYCKNGQYNFCIESKFMASKGYQGALSQYLVWDEKTVHRLDDSLSFEMGALLEPLSVAYSGVLKAKIKNESKVVILGAGSIGVLAAKLIEILSPSTEYCIVDRFEQKILQAKRLGIEPTHFIKEPQDTELKFTHIIDTTGNAVLINKYIKDAKFGCSLIMIGLSETQFPLTIKEIVYKGLNISSVYRYTDTYPVLQELVKNSDVNFENIITHRFSLKQAQLAFEKANDKENSMKVLIDFTIK